MTIETDLNALDDEEFRRVVRHFLAENYPPELRNPPKRLHWAEARPWYMTLAEKGWLAPGWPREHGGMGLSPARQIALTEEYERHGVARTPDQGFVMLGPLIIRYGTEEQKSRFLPKILTGEHIWCQGYSEPNAGSDLAALRTEAVLQGDTFIVNGQKTWTSYGHFADRCFAVVRTDPEAAKHKGLTYMLIDMHSPGVSVRPLKQMTGDSEFNEVSFRDVRVPVENVVGEINGGWNIAIATLMFERGTLGASLQITFKRQIERLMALSKEF